MIKSKKESSHTSITQSKSKNNNVTKNIYALLYFLVMYSKTIGIKENEKIHRLTHQLSFQSQKIQRPEQIITIQDKQKAANDSAAFCLYIAIRNYFSITTLP